MIFNTKNHNYENEYIVVECKQKNKNDGLRQLQDYLQFSKAYMGVWFNGEERAFIRKIIKNGKIYFEDIPNIPNYGERLEDIGKFKRRDLQKTHNLTSTFKAMRNYLAANSVGTRRDEPLAQQIINLIFCKIYDERFTEQDENVTFRAGFDEDSEIVATRIKKIFSEVKRKYQDVFDETDVLDLDPKSISYVVGELQRYCIIEAERDVIGDAFETFISQALKGGQGQFFTPRNVVKMVVEILDPKDDDLILDPACGSGGFLVESLRYIWKKIDNRASKYKWSKQNILEEKMAVGISKIHGVDADNFLSKVAKAYMAITGDGKGGIVCDDSLKNPVEWKQKTKEKIHFEYFDIILTNPPFGKKITVKGEDTLKQFDLSHKWKVDKDKKWIKQELKDVMPPQILFIERCFSFLKENGKMGIVLPDGLLGNKYSAFIRNWISERAKIIAIIDLPMETFMPNTPTKTSVIILQKTKKYINKNYKVFMSIAETCGHDRRKKPIDSDDISIISKEFHKWSKNKV